MSEFKAIGRDDGAKGGITVSREFSVAVPKDEGGYLIPRSDWNRIRSMIRRIAPIENWFQVSASICAGVALSAGFSLLGFASSKDVPTWAKLADWCAMICGIILSMALFALDAKQQKYTVQKTSDVTDEMERIEQLCQAAEVQATDGGDLAILNARYGAGDSWQDVALLLRAKIRNNELRVQAMNEELGCDPAPNVVKSLEVGYSYRGALFHKSVREGQDLSIPELK